MMRTLFPTLILMGLGAALGDTGPVSRTFDRASDWPAAPRPEGEYAKVAYTAGATASLALAYSAARAAPLDTASDAMAGADGHPAVAEIQFADPSLGLSLQIRDGFLLVGLRPLSEGHRIEIRNDRGEKAFTGTVAGSRNEIDFRDRAAGRYLVRIRQNGQSLAAGQFVLR